MHKIGNSDTRQSSIWRRAAKREPRLTEIRKAVAESGTVESFHQAMTEVASLVGLHRMTWDAFLSSDTTWRAVRVELLSAMVQSTETAPPWQRKQLNLLEVD